MQREQKGSLLSQGSCLITHWRYDTVMRILPRSVVGDAGLVASSITPFNCMFSEITLCSHCESDAVGADRAVSVVSLHLGCDRTFKGIGVARLTEDNESARPSLANRVLCDRS